LRTGFIPSSAATVITGGTQNVALLPLAGRSGIRTIEVVNANTGVVYYVEYRTKAGRDLLNVFGVKTGVRVLRYNPDTGDTVLLDPSPSGQSRDEDPTLPVGQTFVSYDGAVTIRTVSADMSNAVVSVTIGTSPVTTPGAPTAVLATPGDTKAVVSWKVPTNIGGSAITGYTVTASPGGKTATTTGATTASVIGLTNGTTYTFTVTATNTVGTSPASVPSATVTPRSGSLFMALSPKRVLDTRIGLGAARAKVGPGGQVTLAVPGLPTGTTAVALNVTATNPTAASYLSVYPAGQTRPTASNLNFVKAQSIPNLVIARVGVGNKVTFYNAAGTVDIIADLAGYYAPGAGVGYTAATPKRVMDTRIGLGAARAKVGPGGQVTLTIPGLLTGTTAVALNVTATNPTASSYLSVYPAGATRPTASNLNFVKGQSIPNLVIARVGVGNKVTFYNAAGTVDIIADLAGYYAP